MNRVEAKIALTKGKKITHRFFWENEYVYLNDGEIHDEKGHNIDSEFWEIRSQDYFDRDWEVFA